MLLSYCIPIRNRCRDLVAALPSVVTAARESPPVEVVVLDYGSTDQLRETLDEMGLPEVAYYFREAQHFHMAHARNVAMLSGRGEWLVSTNADTVLQDSSFFEIVRDEIADGAMFVHPEGMNGVCAVCRQVFEDVRGFDERFEFYGPEDKDFIAQLRRAGYREATIPRHLVANMYTPDDLKMREYRLPLSKRDAAKLMHSIFEQNTRENTVVGNAERWGE